MQHIIVLDEYYMLNGKAIPAFSNASNTILYTNTLNDLPADICPREVIVIDMLPRGTDRASRYQKWRQAAPGSLQLLVSVAEDIHMPDRLLRSVAGEVNGFPINLLHYISRQLDHTTQPAAAPEMQHIKGQSQVMQQIYEMTGLIAPTGYHVILYGETGTGKEVFARLIHALSNRSDKPFIAVDCGCLNKEIASSELFGHVKGAFTDAVTDKTGVFEMADGGTLFLDEISNLSYEVQVSLLRSIQQKTFRKIGSLKEIEVDVRIIVATNEDLAIACAEGTFRQDLYYRLNEVSLYLPPLRERKADLVPFATSIVASIAAELGKTIPGISNEAWQKLFAHDWPGNIRELKNVLKRACLLAAEHHVIDVAHLPPEIRAVNTEAPGKEQEYGDNLKEAAIRAENERILETLKSVQFNKRKAASILNIHRKTLYNKLKMMHVDL